jgi:phosphate/sulfate permease
MPELYLLAVILLFILAISDLVVGVTNDAVNFLNSAVGSKVATFRTIMIVASIGIFIGATFSSGMMEVARKGIFNPQHFQFSEVMVIFLAVMLTDIFLLDTFNTFGLPTSTTVSIVFELLGAAVVVALIKIASNGEGLGTLPTYINTASALGIISGILSSVAIAFVVGAVLQYFSRLLFSFQYERRMKWVGGLWSGLALTFLTYFLLLKGIKGASFVSDEFVNRVSQNTLQLLVVAFIFWSVVMQVLVSLFKVNILRLVVLVGTFSLAMAFAGNDLVNFIGVPIAGFESFKAWSASGVAADEFSMNVLSQKVRTDTILLLIAGVIMTATLWLSRKARTVTETQVNLSRQAEGLEDFSPNAVARGIVRLARTVGAAVMVIIPNSWLEKAEESFQSSEPEKESPDRPAFDLVRASVNLTVASMLIAFATSLKLPLSTTYVTFMVAMGASLADRAWGRDSAVYRVAGVVNVVGGWFLTALAAFTVSGVFAWLMYTFGMYATLALAVLLAIYVFRSFALHRRMEKSKEEMAVFEQQAASIPPSRLVDDTAGKVGETLSLISKAYRDAISGLLEENSERINQARNDLKDLKKQNESFKKKLYKAIKRLEGQDTQAGRLYLLVYDLEQDILQSTGLIVKTCLEHVDNSFKPVKPEQGENLKEIMRLVDTYLTEIVEKIKTRQFRNMSAVTQYKKSLFAEIEKQLSTQIEGIKKNGYGVRNSMLMFSLKLETKDLIAVAARFMKLYSRIHSGESVSLVTGDKIKAART